jgi:hypothetical protein
MSTKTVLLLVSALFLASVVSCGGSRNLFEGETALDKNWGRSYETAKYNQMVNPNAGKNLEPVVGLGGVATENTVNKYDQSFKEKKTQEVTNILKLQ